MQGLAFRTFSGCDGLPDGVGWKYLKVNTVIKATWGKGWQTDKQQTDQKAWGGTGCRSRHIRENDLEKLPTNPGNLEDQMWAQGWIHAQKRHHAFTSGWHLSSAQAVSEGWNWALKLSDQVWKECPNTQLICKAGISISLLASDIPGNFCQTTQWPQNYWSRAFSAHTRQIQSLQNSFRKPPKKAKITYNKQQQEREKLISRVAT